MNKLFENFIAKILKEKVENVQTTKKSRIIASAQQIIRYDQESKEDISPESEALITMGLLNIIDQFDVLMDLNEPQPLVFPLSLHSFIVGQPFRQKHLKRALDYICKRRDEIWITTPNEVSRFYRKLPLDKQLKQ